MNINALRPVKGDHCKYLRPVPNDEEPLHHMLLGADTSYVATKEIEENAEVMFHYPVLDVGVYSEEPMVARGFAPENEVNHALVKQGYVLCVPPQSICIESYWSIFTWMCENVVSHPALRPPNGRRIEDIAVRVKDIMVYRGSRDKVIAREEQVVKSGRLSSLGLPPQSCI